LFVDINKKKSIILIKYQQSASYPSSIQHPESSI